MKLDYVKNSDHLYQVWFNNGNSLTPMGDLIREVDGFFVYYPSTRVGFWSAWIMIDIGNKLNELNKDWTRQIDEYFG